MDDYQSTITWQCLPTPGHDPTTPIQAAAASYSPKVACANVPETPSILQLSEPPTQPPNPPKIRIKRRRAPIHPSVKQPFDFGLSDDLPVPMIEAADMDSSVQPLPITPTSELRRDLLKPISSTSQGLFVSPPRTPVHQIYDSVEESADTSQDWLDPPERPCEEIQRPLSALSVFSDSSATSHGSSESGPSFGGSCTSPESEFADPFVLHDATIKSNKLPAPFLPKVSQHPRKRQKTHTKIKWTTDMDDHLWMTYMAYLSDPTVTPFKTLPGSAPPLGVCHRVAREAKRTWKGTKNSVAAISDSDSTRQRFTSLDAAIMRETSAPPSVVVEKDPFETIKAGAIVRCHSSNDISRRSISKWPRSESSTRRRLRELCKRKPMLPPHYQRLMQTRSPSPFESSSSKGRKRSSRFSPPPFRDSSESSFSTRDLHITLATSTSKTMQPGGPLSQLASDGQTLQQEIADPPAHSSIRGAHQKSQSLQLTLGLGRDLSNSFRRLASPFQESGERHASGLLDDRSPSDIGTEMDRDLTPKPQAKKLDSPLQIHAPRPMSGSMKRRADYQLGEELIADDVEARRNFLEDLFRNPASDSHRRVRSRGFSLGAMRQAVPPSRHLSDVFVRPTVAETQQSTPSSLRLYTQMENINSVEDNSASTVSSNSGGSLAPPAVSHLARRLGSPFAPNAPSGFRNTFPRSLLPQGLESIASMDSQHRQMDNRGYEKEHLSSAFVSSDDSQKR